MKKYIVFAVFFILILTGCGTDDTSQSVVVTPESLEEESEQPTIECLEQAAEILGFEYDFDHDGETESLILKGNAGTLEESSFWALEVVQGGENIWIDTAATSHAGWNNLFAVEINGEDYLLRYNPYMGQGAAGYSYQIFSLNEAGEEVLLNRNYVSFDINFGSTAHQSFDAAAIAAFLEEVHGYLEGSTLLLSTESGLFCSGGSGTNFREDGYFWDEFCPYDPSMTLEENVRNFQKSRVDALGITQ